jgi:hypothetical protein
MALPPGESGCAAAGRATAPTIIRPTQSDLTHPTQLAADIFLHSGAARAAVALGGGVNSTTRARYRSDALRKKGQEEHNRAMTEVRARARMERVSMRKGRDRPVAILQR